MSDSILMNTFIGEYAHNIDKKGRIIIPAQFRDVFNGFIYVAKGLDGCLSLYTAEQFQLLMDKLISMPMTKEETRSFKRNLTARAKCCEIDNQGRILLPANLIAIAGLEKECYIIGAGNTAEIWAKERWDEYSEKHSDDFEEVAEALTEFLL